MGLLRPTLQFACLSLAGWGRRGGSRAEAPLEPHDGWGSSAAGASTQGYKGLHFRPGLNSWDMQRPKPGGSVGVRRGPLAWPGVICLKSLSPLITVARVSLTGPEVSRNVLPPLRGLLIGNGGIPDWIVLFNV